MLWHIRPRLYSELKNVTIIDVTIQPHGLRLVGGADITTGRPYPNKRYTVVRRKAWRRAVDGILIETPRTARELFCTARWGLEAAMVVSHYVLYKLLDGDFDAASDDMMLWYGCDPESGGWSNRWPGWARGLTPHEAEPRMELWPEQPGPGIRDVFDAAGLIVGRHQTFALPTIERERLVNSRLNERLPPLNTAFRVG